MKKIFFLFACIGLLMACSDSGVNEDAVDDVQVTRTVVDNADAPACKAKLAVEGMSCAVMCGGLIKKSLKSLHGVEIANVDFDKDQSVDFAEVEYDENLVTEKELIAAIQKLNNGQYKVKSVEIVVSKTSYKKTDAEEDKDDENKVSAFQQLDNVSIPNIFDVFRVIIQ